MDRHVVFGYFGGMLPSWGHWCFKAVGDRMRLWLKFLSFRGLCCQVAVTPHAQWGAMRQGDLVGKWGGLWDKVEPCLCGDGHRGTGLMGWWWETEMSGKQTPIQSETSKRGLMGNYGAHHHLRSLAWVGEEELGEGRKEKRGGLSCRVHTHHPTTGLLFWGVTWASCHGVHRTYSMCPCKMLWINYFSMLPT